MAMKFIELRPNTFVSDNGCMIVVLLSKRTVEINEKLVDSYISLLYCAAESQPLQIGRSPQDICALFGEIVV